MSENLVRSPWLHVREAAQYARMTIDDMRALVNTGKIPSHRHAGRKRGTLVYAPDIDEYILGLPSAAKVPESLRQ